MRYSEFKILTEAKVGREYQHLEDLVFVDGSAGAQKAADILEKLGSDSGDVAIKWDGYPTMYWGREPDGRFVLVGKNGWGRNKSYSADNLSNFIRNTGKGEEWRDKFANEMGAIFNVMKSATDPKFRGYIYGDILYHPGKPVIKTDSGYQFTPNLVTYTVDPASNLGKRIGNSQVGVVVHTKYDNFGDSSGTPISDVKAFNNKDAVVLGQTYVTHQPSVDTGNVDKIRKFANTHAKAIDSFLAPVAGLSDMKNIIYTYVNQTSRAGKLQQLDKNFFNWLETSKVSPNKQKKIAAMNEQNPKALPAIFSLVKQIMATKDDIIKQLDDAPADVKQSTKGEKGGEGYVALGSKTKLVPRARWTPS